MSRAVRGIILPIPDLLRRSLFIVLFGVAITALVPRAAQADPPDSKSIDTAIDIFVQVGSLAGLPLTKDEVDITKQIVTCAVSGKDAGDCAKTMVVNQLVSSMGGTPDLQSAAGCLAGGGKVGDCVSAAVLTDVPSEARPMVGCIIDGGNVGDCTKKFAEGQVLSQIPDEVKPIAECMLQSPGPKCVTNFIADKVVSAMGIPAGDVDTVKKIVGCIGDGSTSALASCAGGAIPKEIQPLWTCATAPGANLQQCAVKFATGQVANQLPAGAARDAANCLGQKDVQGCATGVAKQQITAAEQQAVDKAIKLVTELNPDSIPQEIGSTIATGTSATLQNIIKVADGIQNGDIGEIILYGGPEIAKLAGKIILTTFVGPEIAGLLGPAVDSMIDTDVQAAMAGLTALYHGDAVGVAEAAFKWYETQFIEGGCSIIPSGAVHDTLCGGAITAINFVADGLGDVAKGILGLGKDFLEAIGLWGPIDSVATAIWDGVTSAVDGLGHLLGFGDDDAPKIVYVCPKSPQDYFTNIVANCIPNAAALQAAGTPDTGNAVSACAGYYGLCAPGGPNDPALVGPQGACTQIGKALGLAAQKASDAANAAAAVYTDRSGAAVFAGKINSGNVKDGLLPPNKERDLCSPSFWSDMQQVYAKDCAAALGNSKILTQAYVQRIPNSCSIPASNSLAEQACLNALKSSSKLGLFAGPDGAYCAKQNQEIAIAAALNPCVPEQLTPVITPSGQVIPNFKCTPALKPPRNLGPITGPVLPGSVITKLPASFTSILGPPKKPPLDTFPAADGLIPPRIVQILQPPKPPPFTLGIGIAGAFGSAIPGIEVALGKVMGNVPTTPAKAPTPPGPGLGPALPKLPTPTLPRGSRTMPRLPPTAAIKPPPNNNTSGGTNSSRNSAMDNLEHQTDGGLGGVAGNAGGAGLGGFTPPRAPRFGGTTPGVQAGSPAKNGTLSGNAPPAGGGTVRPRAGGGTVGKPPPDPKTDYGGCAGCTGKPAPFVAPR
jgi:hypothetical protein